MKKVIVGILSTVLVVLVILTINLSIKHNKLVLEGDVLPNQNSSTVSSLPHADSPDAGVNVDLMYSYTEQEVMNAIDGLEIVDLYSQKKILFEGSRVFIESGVNRYYRDYYVTKEDGLYNLHIEDCTYEVSQSQEGLVVNCRGSLYTIEVN